MTTVRRAATGAALLTVGALLGACSATAEPAGDATGAIYRLEGEACSGVEVVEATAFAIAPDRLVTVAHAFDDVRSFRIIPAEAESPELDVDVLLLDIGRDVAVLGTSSPVVTALEPAAAEAGAVGRLLTAAEAGDLRTKRVVIDDITPVRVDGAGERLALALDADIRPGDSGAPVVDGDGAVVGMVFAAVEGETAGWAIAADELGPLVERADDATPMTARGCD